MAARRNRILVVEDDPAVARSLKAGLPHLFERFYRGRYSGAYPGSGLGLAIVKAIAERHDGQNQAERTEQGARFTIKLPSS